jgi:hypothetical protein
MKHFCHPTLISCDRTGCIPDAWQLKTQGWRMAPPLKESIGYRVNFLVDDAGFDGFLTQAVGNRDAVVAILHVVV